MKVIKIGAVWCSGCLVMRPRWKKIESTTPWLQTEYFDFDNDKEKIEKYKVGRNLPVFIFLDKNGDEIKRLTGELSEKEIIKRIEEYKNE